MSIRHMTAELWTTNGRDIWRIVGEKLFYTLKNLDTGDECSSPADGTDGFIPVVMPKTGRNVTIKQRRKAVRKKAGTAKPSKEQARTPPVQRGRKTKSHYKGVRRQPGGRRWEAKYYDKVKKKTVYIGMFEAELLAAAAVCEKEGRKKEAKRLRNEYEEGDRMPEQADRMPEPSGEKRILPRKNAKKKSKYKGVTLKKNGRWDAVWRDGRSQKCVRVGKGFESDILAAACYQDHIGNHAEAERLRAEYKAGSQMPREVKAGSMTPGDWQGA